MAKGFVSNTESALKSIKAALDKRKKDLDLLNDTLSKLKDRVVAGLNDKDRNTHIEHIAAVMVSEIQELTSEIELAEKIIAEEEVDKTNIVLNDVYSFLLEKHPNTNIEMWTDGTVPGLIYIRVLKGSK